MTGDGGQSRTEDGGQKTGDGGRADHGGRQVKDSGFCIIFPSFLPILGQSILFLSRPRLCLQEDLKVEVACQLVNAQFLERLNRFSHIALAFCLPSSAFRPPPSVLRTPPALRPRGHYPHRKAPRALQNARMGGNQPPAGYKCLHSPAAPAPGRAIVGQKCLSAGSAGFPAHCPGVPAPDACGPMVPWS